MARRTPTAISTSGTALNKILKDVVNRSQQMLGKDAVYVPGWDCHGLPIEWQIEQDYRKRGKDKDAVPIADFRKECREYAERWIDMQRAEFKRLGVLGDWQRPYTTMDYRVRGGDLPRAGQVPARTARCTAARSPVMWSRGREDRAGRGRGRVSRPHVADDLGRFPGRPRRAARRSRALRLVIWTTTPWTMPANRAIAYGEEFAYVVLRVDEVADGSLARPGQRLVVAAALAPPSRRRRTSRPTASRPSWRAASSPARCAPPAAAWPTATGSTCPCCRATSSAPRTAPGSSISRPSHGEDDFELGRAMASRCRIRSAEDGRYTDAVPASPACTCSRRRSRWSRRCRSAAPCWRAERWSTATRIPGDRRRR